MESSTKWALKNFGEQQQEQQQGSDEGSMKFKKNVAPASFIPPHRRTTLCHGLQLQRDCGVIIRTGQTSSVAVQAQEGDGDKAEQ